VARRESSASSPRSAVLDDPRDGSYHDDVVHEGWEQLEPGKRYGRAVPRVFTPPLRELVPEVRDESGRITQEATSWGYRVIVFAAVVLEIRLMPWQRWLLIHMLELDRRGRLRFQTVVVLVARQNGKSTLSQVLSLWFMIEAKWPLVLGTAQDLTTAEEVWEGAVALLEDDPELTTLIAKLSQRNGKKMVTLTNATRYLVKAASRKAGRGLSGNLILLDELREQQNWAAWGAITKTTNAQTESLIVGLSNAGDITSVVLRYLRLLAHKAVGDPDGLHRDVLGVLPGPSVVDVDPIDPEDEDEVDELLDELEQDEDTLFLAEWSAIPGIAVKDRDGWAQANPALGYRVQERKIAGDARTDPEWIFRTEVLCQWSDSTLEGPFAPGSWEQGTNEPVQATDIDGEPLVDEDGKPVPELDERGAPIVREADKIVGRFDVCIDQSSDRGTVWIVAVGTRRDGKQHAEVMIGLPGTDRVSDFLLDPVRRSRINRVTGQWRGAPISLFMAELQKDPKFPLEVVEWQGGALTGGTGLLLDAVRDVTVRHHKQPALDIAAATAVLKQLGGEQVIDRFASESDVSPLIGMAGALWLHRQRKTAPPPPPPPPAVLRKTDDGSAGGNTLTGDLSRMSF